MCLEGKSEAKKKPGRYQCKRCGAVSKEQDNMCKPGKIKTMDTTKDKKKTKKKDKKKKKQTRKKSIT
jgi:hypothetical protein